jgi:hypothetical protein
VVRERVRPRRELQLAISLCLLGSVLVLWAVGQAWVVTVDTTDLTLAGARTQESGTELVGGVQPLGYVALVSVLALVATRSWGRLLVGLVVLGSGAGIVVVVADALANRPLTAPGWAWLALLGGAVLALAGLLTVVRGRGWPGLGRDYDAPSKRSAGPVTDKSVWDALDRGDDPTA